MVNSTPATNASSRAVFRSAALGLQTGRGSFEPSPRRGTPLRQGRPPGGTHRFDLGLDSGAVCALTLVPVEGGYVACISVDDPAMMRSLAARVRYLEGVLSSSILGIEIRSNRTGDVGPEPF